VNNNPGVSVAIVARDELSDMRHGHKQVQRVHTCVCGTACGSQERHQAEQQELLSN
jgi:hypothetical protein